MNLHDWIDELSDLLDVETEVDEGLLSDLDKLAHEKVDHGAGPVTAYLLGYAAGRRTASPETVERLAGEATELAENWDRPAGAPDPDDIDDDIPDDRGVDHAGDVRELADDDEDDQDDDA